MQQSWPELKRGYRNWRTQLYSMTLETLTGEDDLAAHNNLGYYHMIRDANASKQMKQDWERLQRVPAEWISKGVWPGIWLAMFDPHNTYSIHNGPLSIARVYFKPGFFVFNCLNPNHAQLWESWEEKGAQNPWASLSNSRDQTLKGRLEKTLFIPSHKKFYQDHRFGAAIGYSDYISPVILLEDSVERFDFLDPRNF